MASENYHHSMLYTRRYQMMYSGYTWFSSLEQDGTKWHKMVRPWHPLTSTHFFHSFSPWKLVSDSDFVTLWRRCVRWFSPVLEKPMWNTEGDDRTWSAPKTRKQYIPQIQDDSASETEQSSETNLPRDFPCDLPPFTWPDKRRYMPGDPSQNESLLLGRPHPSVDATAHLPTDQEITIRVVPSGCPFRLSLPVVPSGCPFGHTLLALCFAPRQGKSCVILVIHESIALVSALLW